MRRNLFKFVTLNSFKIVWVVSVVLFTCVIANAQITREQMQMGKDKAVVQCIENFKVTAKEGKYGKILTISFRTKTAVEAEVTLDKWGSYFSDKPKWVPVSGNNGLGIAEEGVSQPTENHSFQIGLDYPDALTPGNKYRLYLTARAYKGTFTTSGGIGRSLDRTYSCEREFSLIKPMKSLNNLRLRRPKP